jgi:hypothetical protein
LPLPYDVRSANLGNELGQLDQGTVDSWAAVYTRRPSVSLVSARSLFWDRDAHIGAVEVIYIESPPEWYMRNIKHIVRVAIIPTAKGVCTIAFFDFGAPSKSVTRDYNDTWKEVLNGISVK